MVILKSKKALIVIISLGLFLCEAIVKAVFHGFPLTELYAAQVPIVLGFLGVQATSDIKEAKYANKNNAVDR